MNWRKLIIITALKITNSNIYNNFKLIKKISKCKKIDIKKYQEKKLKDLLKYCYKNNEYYSKLIKEYKIYNGKKFNLSNFSRLPIITKETLAQNYKKIYSHNEINRFTFLNTSGGSTGQPITIIQDKYYKEWNIANKLFYAWNLDKDIGEREIKFWGSEKDIFEGTIGYKEKIFNFLYNRFFLNSFRMTPRMMNDYVYKINQIKPKHIWTYVDSIFELAKFIEKQTLKVYSPNSIVTTAGVLTFKVRKYIEKIFKTKVYNQYGSREVGDIAAECKYQNGLHIFEWTHFVEIINEKIIITLLTNYSFPLIRYQIGDTGLFSKSYCRCGVKTSRIENVTGRTTDHFVLKNGTIIHGEFFTHLFYFKNWVKKFKVIQKNYNEIVCQIAINGKINTDDIHQIKKDINLVMGRQCKVKFKYYKNLPPSRSGKYLYTFSEIYKNKNE